MIEDKLVIATRQKNDVIFTHNAMRAQLRSQTNMATYGKDAFVYGDDIDNLSEFDDNLDELEAFEDEEDQEDNFCICGKANDDQMIMCESEECAGCIWYHYPCAGFPNGNIPDEDEVWTCVACKGS